MANLVLFVPSLTSLSFLYYFPKNPRTTHSIPICCGKILPTKLHLLVTLLFLFSLCHVQLFVTPWTAARQASLSIANSKSLLRLMSIKSVMPSNQIILCHPLLLPSIFPSIGVFSNELALPIRWPKYWSFNFSISPSNEYSGRSLGLTGWISLPSKGLSRVFSNTTVQKH